MTVSSSNKRNFFSVISFSNFEIIFSQLKLFYILKLIKKYYFFLNFEKKF